MTFSQPVGKLSDCGWFASVGEERRATHRVVKPVVFEAQHDAVLCVVDDIVGYCHVVLADFLLVVVSYCFNVSVNTFSHRLSLAVMR